MTITFEPNSKLRLEGFPEVLDCIESDPEDPSYMGILCHASETQQKKTVFVKVNHLRAMGLSITVLRNGGGCSEYIQQASRISILLRNAIPVVSQYLKKRHFTLFKEKIPLMNRVIALGVLEERTRCYGVQGIPEIYILKRGIFIDLKGVGYLGSGSFGKVSQVLWLDAPNCPTVVAKKVVKDPQSKRACDCLEKELAALNIFRDKRGIISMIEGGVFEDEIAIFFPIYQCSFRSKLKDNRERKISFTQRESLNLISQVLEGVATISEEGTHGDLSFSNLLLRKDRSENLEIVISDFGSCRSYASGEYGITTITHAPPEYFALRDRGPKHDVWAVGIILYELFSVDPFPWPQIKNEETMHQWTAGLTPGWVLNRTFRENTPEFVLKLMDQMLTPCQVNRPLPTVCWQRFSSGYKSFLKKKRSEQKSL